MICEESDDDVNHEFNTKIVNYPVTPVVTESASIRRERYRECEMYLENEIACECSVANVAPNVKDPQ